MGERLSIFFTPGKASRGTFASKGGWATATAASWQVAVIYLLLGLLLGRPAAVIAGNAERNEVRIGILAVRGAETCLRTWGPTAAYLTSRIAGKTFVVVPLSHDGLVSSVATNAVDFVLANPSIYVELEQLYGASRIATLKEFRMGRAYSRYGGVIFHRAGSRAIGSLADLQGKRFMAVAENSFGGWQAAWRELLQAGIDPYRDFQQMLFGNTHDEVVYAVRDGLVDAGSVRTNTLEVMAQENKIDLRDFQAIPSPYHSGQPLPYLCSTREYPDWPMARVNGTSDELAELVAISLLEMAADDPAAKAADCAGWTIPLNYQPVMECMMALRIGPYKDLGKITWRDFLRNYGGWVLFGAIFFTTHTLFTLKLIRLNRRSSLLQHSLQAEIEEHQKTDRELERARLQAEAATLAKSRFLANMSHEIRTPMNGIVAATDLALAETVSPELEHYLQIIQNSSISLLGIINDILDFSKIEAGQFELRNRLFRLEEMLDRVMEIFVGPAAVKGLELLVDIASQTPRLLVGDSLRLQQVLTNLIGNSVKFTPAGGVIVVTVVSREGEASGTTELEFSVKDSGIGIDKAALGSLFEPFTQGDTSSTRKFEGTGLGLSICKKLVTMMAGRIWVDTTPGEGSTFSFTVRLGIASPAAEGARQLPEDLRGLHVMVVDDCLDNREVMCRMLSTLALTVESYHSAEEALVRLQQQGGSRPPVALIFMDWKMPVMDGIDATQYIRQELKLEMPVIIMTAYSKEVRRSDAERAGANGFLAKPIFPVTLYDAILDAFGKSSESAVGGASPFTTLASMYKRDLAGSRILLAEDNLTNQQVAQAILTKAGIEVVIVGNGEEAVDLVRTSTFDAVLMDIQMPRLNGYQATGQIRELPQGRDLPIIAMTAHALKGDEERCLESGMDGYVSKPVDQDRLFCTIHRFVKGRKKVSEMLNAGKGRERLDGQDICQRSMAVVLPPEAELLTDFDVRGILSLSGLDWSTYLLIVKGFAEDNRQTGSRLQRAFADGDQELLRRLAHKIKGSAANIGATALFQAAAALEEQSKTAESELAGAVASLLSELEIALSNIDRLHAPVADLPAVASVSHEADPQAVSDLLVTLDQAMQAADPQEIKVQLSQLVARLAGEPGNLAALVAQLESQARLYEYEEGRKTIAAIREVLEKSHA